MKFSSITRSPFTVTTFRNAPLLITITLALNRYFLLTGVFTFLGVNIYGQPGEPMYKISRSTLGAGGSTERISTVKNDFIVCQSIGQASVIGTFHKNDYTVLQGYQQPFIQGKGIKSNPGNTLRVKVYPNPFHESIRIELEDPIKSSIDLSLSDMTGRIFYTQHFPAIQLIQLTGMKIAEGMYVVHLVTANSQGSVTLIKQ